MDKFKYEKRYWYPHMGPQDVKIWERFIDRNPDRFDFCIYDLPVGDEPLVRDVTDAGQLDSWIYRCKYKVDVVAWKGSQCYIIEIKPRADMRTFGQVRGYRLLYQEYIDRNSQPELIIITDGLRPDMDWMADEEGVKLEVV